MFLVTASSLAVGARDGLTLGRMQEMGEGSVVGGSNDRKRNTAPEPSTLLETSTS